ncbi:MAG: galactokinase, partial [Bacteroidetes bacterium CG18_big_fil_WC_8_21_14_2_50_41_14]
MIQNIKNTFIQKFGTEPLMVKSPGRVNLIGEHTDYNNGFVLPAAVNKAIYFAVSPNQVHQFRFFAIDLDESFETAVDQIEICSVHWANFLLGVIAQFIKDGKSVAGFDCVFGGDVPLGAGMSSSAAIECGMAFAINHMQHFDYNRLQLAQFAQKGEHEYAGVQCGIMDQFASLHGKANQVIKLDCRSLEYELFPFDMTDYLLVLVNTGVKHALASSEYNIRRL